MKEMIVWLWFMGLPMMEPFAITRDCDYKKWEVGDHVVLQEDGCFNKGDGAERHIGEVACISYGEASIKRGVCRKQASEVTPI